MAAESPRSAACESQQRKMFEEIRLAGRAERKRSGPARLISRAGPPRLERKSVPSSDAHGFELHDYYRVGVGAGGFAGLAGFAGVAGRGAMPVVAFAFQYSKPGADLS